MSIPCRCLGRIKLKGVFNKDGSVRGSRTCDARRSLSKKPSQYLRPPRCACGSTKWAIDKTRIRTKRKQESCWCEGYWFEHRKGSGRCVFHKDFEKHFEKTA